MAPSTSVAPGANDASIPPIVQAPPADPKDVAPKASVPTPQQTAPRQSTSRRIQVSREKRPLNFFIALARKSLNANATVELSGLGLAVSNVITIAEVLRADGRAHIDDIQTALVEPSKGHSTSSKPKIQIWLSPTEPDAIAADSTDKQVEAVDNHAGNTNPSETQKVTEPAATPNNHSSQAS